MTASSMALEESMHFFGQLAANPLNGGNLVHSRFAETIYRTKSPQQQILSVLAHTRTIVQNAFLHPLFHEQLVIGVCEPMGFITNALKQSQSRRVHRQSQWQRAPRPINLLVFLGKADNGKIVQTESLQFTTRS